MSIPLRGESDSAPKPTPTLPSGARPTLLKPLPRVRLERFSWQWPDTAWLLVAAASCFGFTPRHDAGHLRLAIGLVISIASACCAYLAGLKMHSRVAGITAAALVATSADYTALCVQHPVSGAIACATILAVASYSVGWMLVTYCAACLSFTLGFNGALVGLVIAAVPLVQRREHSAAGATGYVAFALLWSVATHSVHLPHGFRPLASWQAAAPLGGLAAFVAWFFVPFYAEATLRGARERWLLGLALVGVLLLIVFTSKDAVRPQIYDAFPIAMLVVSVALARLIPLISGDYPSPSRRYVSAVLAVFATVLLKLVLEPAVSFSQPKIVPPLGAGRKTALFNKIDRTPVQNNGFACAIRDKSAIYGNNIAPSCFASRLIEEVRPVESRLSPEDCS